VKGQALAADSVPVVLTALQLSTLTPLPTVTANIGTIGTIATETTLNAINTKFPVKGQALAADSVPVVLTASQISTLTPLATVAVSSITNTVPVSLPKAASTGIDTVQTAATGTNYVTLASHACTGLEIANDSGTKLVYRFSGAGATMPIFDSSRQLIIGITNSNQVDVKRADDSNSRVTVSYQYYT
jgi:hypothetical protein